MTKGTTIGRSVRALGAAAAMMGALALSTNLATAQDNVFKVWWYEPPNSSQATAWNAAIVEFKSRHPEVTVEFEQKSWDQMEKAGILILNSGDVPDLLEYNKGNGFAGLAAS